MSKWKPINTAPKDGTSILIGSNELGVMVAHWNGYYWDDGDWNSEIDWPTHWMPRPPLPPKVEKEDVDNAV